MDPRARGSGRGPVPLRPPVQPLHLVTDDGVVMMSDFLARAAAAIEAGGARVAVHLRTHGHPGRRIYEWARALRGLCDRHGAFLWINDRVDVALAVRADGIQVGRRGLPIRDVRSLVGTAPRIGYSAHSVGEAREAVAEGADAVILGPVYRSASHPGERGLGPGILREASAIPLPVLAIGGISSARVREVRSEGAAGVAVLRGVWEGAAEESGRRVASYLEAWDTG